MLGPPVGERLGQQGEALVVAEDRTPFGGQAHTVHQALEA